MVYTVTFNPFPAKASLMMKHLRVGVKKGAFTEEEAQRKFEEWKATRTKATDAAKAKLNAAAEADAKHALMQKSRRIA